MASINLKEVSPWQNSDKKNISLDVRDHGLVHDKVIDNCMNNINDLRYGSDNLFRPGDNKRFSDEFRKQRDERNYELGYGGCITFNAVKFDEPNYGMEQLILSRVSTDSGVSDSSLSKLCGYTLYEPEHHLIEGEEINKIEFGDHICIDCLKIDKIIGNYLSKIYFQQ